MKMKILRSTLSWLFKIRTMYQWQYRPYFIRPLQRLLDFSFHLNSIHASVDCPEEVADSIHILEATLSIRDRGINVTSSANIVKDREFQRNMTKSSGHIPFYAEDLLPAGEIVIDHLERFWLEIKYLGHADTEKKIGARVYGVKYTAKAGEPIIFPPYSVKTKRVNRLGNPRVIKAHRNDNTMEDMTELAREYAGLRSNFYEDCTDPNILKSHVPGSPTTVSMYHSGCVKFIQVTPS